MNNWSSFVLMLKRLAVSRVCCAQSMCIVSSVSCLTISLYGCYSSDWWVRNHNVSLFCFCTVSLDSIYMIMSTCYRAIHPSTWILRFPIMDQFNCIYFSMDFKSRSQIFDPPQCSCLDVAETSMTSVFIQVTKVFCSRMLTMKRWRTAAQNSTNDEPGKTFPRPTR